MTRRPAELSDAEALELLHLVDASDSVELKLTVPDAEQRSTVQSLGLETKTALRIFAKQLANA